MATLALSLGILGCGGAFAAGPAVAADRSASCPVPGSTPGIGNTPRFTDNNVAVYAGGDYTADGGTAEAEGLLVVRGDAKFDKGGVFNVGRAGAGSGILPAAGEVMLAVGGGLAIAEGTTVDVGHGLVSGPGYGGSVRVGGEQTGEGELTTNGGSLTTGKGAKEALGAYASFGGTLKKESAGLGALKPTGTAKREGGSVTFTGAGKDGLQVFEISAADLDGTSSYSFKSIPDGSPVVVNVTGSQPVRINPLSVGFDGEQADLYSSSKFGEAASRILYNFEDVTSLTLGGGGNFMGSILAPEASADITASTNGRLYIGKDVRTHGSGNESHNYPWTGTPAFACRTGEPTKPEEPTKPAEPGQPEQPEQPAKPEEPGDSANPSQPASPSRPATTDQPSESAAQPAPEPSEPSSAPSEDTGLLATTGAGPAALVAAVAGVVLALGAVLFALSRRRRRA
ncbi:choice-of-anchor A family protein [Streptomyces sp. NPDC006367]|uniref:choice-of-anchor A family protein n=1 Tax=unclassified Streptomyces TaxID=2593676 RepID=UPI0033BDC0FC